MFGISQNVRSRAVQVCTPELFHQVTRSQKVADICAQIADARERKMRGELSREDYDTMKTGLKSQLPILTPHATFLSGRRLNKEAVPSGLSIYDKDHIADPLTYWEEKKRILANIPLSEALDGKTKGKVAQNAKRKTGHVPTVLDCIVLVHITPSLEGLRLVFVIPNGMDLAQAQHWMSEQLGDAEYDSCVKDLARPSYLVPESYILHINEEELFRDRSQKPSQMGSISKAKKDQNSDKKRDENEEDSVKEEGNKNGASAENNAAKTGAKNGEVETKTGEVETKTVEVDNTSEGKGSSPEGKEKGPEGSKKGSMTPGFPSSYDGIPYPTLIAKLVELLGGEPQHGSRNSFIFSLACYLRYLCDDNRAWIKAVCPTFGEAEERAHLTIDSACSRKQSDRMPALVRKAIQLCRAEQASGSTTDYDAECYGDTANPESYFYHVTELPARLPKLIRLLVSKTPEMYRPAVSQAVFPALAAHLCGVRFRYVDNVEHEATMMSILCAPTGSGKDCITQPINRIMADIRKRDAEQRERERAWKDECARKGANKDRRERPEGLVIQEVNVDMTNPAFVLRMKEAEGHFLYAKLNELNLFDALKGKSNQHFRIMELAFDLGWYGQDRVGVGSVTETVQVRFNWNACCTPKKCRDYFRRVVTDGPVSRISFATIERRPCGSEIPVYGTYDAAFDEELRPYIDNLCRARGAVDCPEAAALALKLLEENAEMARLSQDRVFENLSYRATVIAYLKACVLYVANGMQWDKLIGDFVRWSLRYDLWCKLRLFGQMIAEADGEQDKADTAAYGPRNLLALLPEEFTLDDYIKVRQMQGLDTSSLRRIRKALDQWVFRGYIVRLEANCCENANDNEDMVTGYGYSSIFRKLKFRTQNLEFRI